MLAVVHARRIKDPIGLIRFASEPSAPAVIEFIDSSVEIMVVHRGAFESLGPELIDDWSATGVYLLVGAPEATASHEIQRVQVRPGLAKGSVLTRVAQHLRDSGMDWASRIVLVRDTRGFNSSEAGYLEGMLHKACRASDGITHPFKIDIDKTLKPHEELELQERYLRPVVATLEFIGVPIAR